MEIGSRPMKVFTSTKGHLAYCLPTVPAKYLKEEHLMELLAELTENNPEEWKREFSILISCKGSI